MRALYTPGHASDHVSLLLNPINKENEENYLFSGDIILGTPSTSVQDLSSYMDSLYALRREKISHICLPHTMDIDPNSLIVSGKEKIEAYIQYREDRDKTIKSCF